MACMSPHDYIAVAIIIAALLGISIFSIRSSFRRADELLHYMVENAKLSAQRASLLRDTTETSMSRSGVGELEEPDGSSASAFGGADSAPRLVSSNCLCGHHYSRHSFLVGPCENCDCEHCNLDM